MTRMWMAVSCALVCGCVADETAQTTDEIKEHTPQAVGVLAFVNGPDATVARLDIDVGLDSRAARNIVADRPYSSIAALDAVPYVGKAALAKLLAYVTSIGGIPDHLVEGVALTGAQEAAIVDVANHATESALAVAAGLASRAAHAIVTARPLATIEAVAAVPYVGATAIAKLRDYAAAQGSDDACTGTGLVWTVPDDCMDDGGDTGVGDSMEVYCVHGRARFCLSGEACPWRDDPTFDDGTTCSRSGIGLSPHDEGADFMTHAWCSQWRAHEWTYCAPDGQAYF